MQNLSKSVKGLHSERQVLEPYNQLVQYTWNSARINVQDCGHIQEKSIAAWKIGQIFNLFSSCFLLTIVATCVACWVASLPRFYGLNGETGVCVLHTEVVDNERLIIPANLALRKNITRNEYRTPFSLSFKDSNHTLFKFCWTMYTAQKKQILNMSLGYNASLHS